MGNGDNNVIVAFFKKSFNLFAAFNIFLYICNANATCLA